MSAESFLKSLWGRYFLDCLLFAWWCTDLPLTHGFFRFMSGSLAFSGQPFIDVLLPFSLGCIYAISSHVGV